MEQSQSILSQSPQETLALGQHVASRLRGGERVLLNGSLGAGKSVLVRGLAQGLGARTWLGSPTFSLVHEYDTKPALYHVDLYRLQPAEVMDLGLEEYCRTDSVLVVEWADRATQYLADLSSGPLLTIDIALSRSQARTLVLTGSIA